MKTTSKSFLEIMFEGDNTEESKQFESKLLNFFRTRKFQDDKIHIIRRNYEDRTQLSGVVYGVDEIKKIERLYLSLSAFVGNVSDMIGFEIAERQQTSDSYTLVNKSGFKLTATLEED